MGIIIIIVINIIIIIKMAHVEYLKNVLQWKEQDKDLI